MNGIEDMEHFMALSPDDLDQLNIEDDDTRARIIAALSYVIEECESQQALSLSPNFVRHVNGRISLPAAVGSSVPFRGVGGPPLLSHQHHQIYENFYFHDDYSSSSTDTSSGYHSRPPTFSPPTNINLPYAPPTSSSELAKDSYRAHVIQVDATSPLEGNSESTNC